MANSCRFAFFASATKQLHKQRQTIRNTAIEENQALRVEEGGSEMHFRFCQYKNASTYVIHESNSRFLRNLCTVVS